MQLITVLQNTENTRAGGELKGLILASVVWYKICAAGIFAKFFCNFQNSHAKFIYL